MKLNALVGRWIKDHESFNKHFVVVLPSILSAWQKKDDTEGWITFTCANTSAFRQSVGNDRLFKIYETYIEDAGVKIEAADPHLFEKLEQLMRSKHDRTGEFNIVTFRDDCPVKLRTCGHVKAFCGC